MNKIPKFRLPKERWELTAHFNGEEAKQIFEAGDTVSVYYDPKTKKLTFRRMRGEPQTKGAEQ